MQSSDGIYTIVSMIFAFSLVAVLAYITTRYVGLVSTKGLKNKNMKIVEVMSMGYQKFLYIVQIADKNVVLAVTKDDVKLIDTIDSEKLVKQEVDNETLLGKDFKSILETFTKKK